MQNIYVDISSAIFIFSIVLDQIFRRGDGKWLQGRMHDSNVILRKSDPEEEMNYSTDHVLHKTKSVTVIYIWISAVYVMTYKSFLSVLRKFSMMFTHA